MTGASIRSRSTRTLPAATVHSKPGAELQQLLAVIDQAFDRKSWHGTNLRGSIRGLTARQAAWRPQPARRNIAEQVLHAAYWKYVVRRRLRGDKRGSFVLKGSNWFEVDEAKLTEGLWSDYVELLEQQHRLLRETIADQTPAAIKATRAGSTVSNFALITGIAAHDLYHAGQIQLLKAMQRGAA